MEQHHVLTEGALHLHPALFRHQQGEVIGVTILSGRGLRNVTDVYVEEHWREC